MKIFVINLRRSNDRRQHMMEQLERLGLEYEMFDAIDGQAKPLHRLFAKYDSITRLKWKVRPLSQGEVGCFASHYSLWEICVRLNEPIVVLEDDLLLDEALPGILEDVGRAMGRFHYLRLGRLFERSMMSLGAMSRGRHYVKYLQPAGGAQGYVIDPLGASTLIRHAGTWIEPVDNYMDREWNHGLPSIGVEPPCVAHSRVSKSNIGPREIVKARVSLRIRREVVRIYEKLRYALFNMRFIARCLLLSRMTSTK